MHRYTLLRSNDPHQQIGLAVILAARTAVENYQYWRRPEFAVKRRRSFAPAATDKQRHEAKLALLQQRRESTAKAMAAWMWLHGIYMDRTPRLSFAEICVGIGFEPHVMLDGIDDGLGKQGEKVRGLVERYLAKVRETSAAA